MGNFREETGQRIKQIREEQSLSLVRFGEILGLGKTAVHQYERGQTSPNLETLVRIAEIGGRSLDWLITGREPERAPKLSKTDAIIQALRSEPEEAEKIGWELVGEHQAGYRRSPDDPLERRLLSQFRRLHSAEKEKVIEIAELYAAAKDPRSARGGGDDSQESNCG